MRRLDEACSSRCSPPLRWSHDASELFSLCCLPLQLCFLSHLCPPAHQRSHLRSLFLKSLHLLTLLLCAAGMLVGDRNRIYLAQPPHLVIERPPPCQSQCEKQPKTPATPLSSPAAGMPANLAKQAAAFPLRSKHNLPLHVIWAKHQLHTTNFQYLAMPRHFTHRRAPSLGGFRPKALHLLPVLLQGCVLGLQRRGLRLATPRAAFQVPRVPC